MSVHTDNPYRKPVPGIQILHCIANEAKGGDTALVDGYSVCEYLRKNNKSYFDTLTSTEVFTSEEYISLIIFGILWIVCGPKIISTEGALDLILFPS